MVSSLRAWSHLGLPAGLTSESCCLPLGPISPRSRCRAYLPAVTWQASSTWRTRGTLSVPESLAAGPYGCAQSAAASAVPYFPAALGYNLAQAENGCMADRLAAFGILDAARLIGLASRLASSGEIDPLSNLKRSKVYLYWGGSDTLVARPVVEAARNFYLAADVPGENVQFVTRNPGGHAFLTEDQGSPCSSNAPPYIDDCRYDQAEAVLT